MSEWERSKPAWHVFHPRCRALQAYFPADSFFWCVRLRRRTALSSTCPATIQNSSRSKLRRTRKPPLKPPPPPPPVPPRPTRNLPILRACRPVPPWVWVRVRVRARRRDSWCQSRRRQHRRGGELRLRPHLCLRRVRQPVRRPPELLKDLKSLLLPLSELGDTFSLAIGSQLPTTATILFPLEPFVHTVEPSRFAS